MRRGRRRRREEEENEYKEEEVQEIEEEREENVEQESEEEENEVKEVEEKERKRKEESTEKQGEEVETPFRRTSSLFELRELVLGISLDSGNFILKQVWIPVTRSGKEFGFREPFSRSLTQRC